jgi:hypothetical protein
MGESMSIGPWIIAIEISLLIALLLMGYLVWRNRRFLKKNARVEKIKPEENLSLQELVDRAKRENPDAPLNIMLGNGSYSVDNEIEITSPVRMIGNGTEETKIVSKGDHPAITIKDTDDCLLDNVRIEGAINCSNGKVHLNNCHVVAKDDGVCIEANDGSVVTFSGMIRGEGGIAIRAKGESRVVLKPPYALSGDDFIIMDPKSQVSMEDKSQPDSADK